MSTHAAISLDRRTTDFLVIGGGVMGVCLALEARRRYPDASVILIEKEPAAGQHASGRNSGVLHAGFYYTADSLKARFTREGNVALTQYCEERGLPLRRCGKLVVARDERDWPGVDELLRRARLNGVELEPVTAPEAREIEPRARTYERALYSPKTAVVDAPRVIDSLVSDARQAGVTLRMGTAYLGRWDDVVRTSSGPLFPGYVINAAGLYADRIARDWGFSERYRILPFKGLYLTADGAGPSLRTHIYPVPELSYPFLGVHHTLTSDGAWKIGPTATPAFWRENYRGWTRFRLGEALEVGHLSLGLLLRNDFQFRQLASRELRKTSKRRLLALASALVDGPLPEKMFRWTQPGIRAQLFDLRERRLVMDFRFEGDDRSFHVLNAVSPAFTCAIPFCRYLFDEIDRRCDRRSARPARDPGVRLDRGAATA